MSFLRLLNYFLFFSVFQVHAETIPSTEIINYKSDLAYIINAGPKVVVGSNYEEACSQLITYGYLWKVISSNWIEPACYSPSNNMLLGADTWYCANGSLAYYNVPWWSCNVFHACLSNTWTLSSDELHCTRPEPNCSVKPSEVSEIKLLAAIIYGEASVNSTFEEKAAIANAVIRFRDSYHYKSVNQLIAKKPDYSSAVKNRVVRYRIVMCSDVEIEYPEVYKAVSNALDPNGIDYANEGCFWDGFDLVTLGTKQPHYIKGYKFTNPLHDVLSVGDSQPANKHGANGAYDYTYESTAGYGETVFWKYTKEFMNAKGVKQCR